MKKSLLVILFGFTALNAQALDLGVASQILGVASQAIGTTEQGQQVLGRVTGNTNNNNNYGSETEVRQFQTEQTIYEQVVDAQGRVVTIPKKVWVTEQWLVNRRTGQKIQRVDGNAPMFPQQQQGYNNGNTNSNPLDAGKNAVRTGQDITGLLYNVQSLSNTVGNIRR